MRFKRTFWMMAALAVIALYYFLVDLPTEQKKKEEKLQSEKVLIFAADDVEEFSFTRGGETLRLQRTGKESWKIIEPVKAQADNPAFLNFTADLQILKIVRVVEESPADLAVYGLKEPSLVFTLKLKDQGEITLSVGDNHPMGHNFYARRSGEDKVLLVSAFRDDLEKSLFDLRDKSLLNFERDKVTRISLEREDGITQLAKTGDSWKLLDTPPAQGDSDEVRNFLHSLLRAKIKTFVEETPQSLSEFGLDSPAIRLTLTMEEEENTLTLLIGNKKGKDGYYSKMEAAKNVVLVGKNLVNTLSQNPAVFLDKKLLDFEIEDVTALQIHSREEDIEIARNEKDPSLWRIAKPETISADTATMNSLLFDLKDARVKEFVKTIITDAHLFGLDKPHRRLTITPGKNPPLTLNLGNQTSDGKHYFAGRSSDSTVFVITDETVNKIFRSLHDLKNKKLLSFKTDEISRILVEYPAKTFELKKKGKEWNLLQPESIRNVKAFLATDILWTLNSLEYESIVRPSPDEEESGLDKPSVTISIWNLAGDKAGQVRVGNPAEENSERFAKVGEKPAVYKIKKRFLDEIPSDLSKFKS